MYAHRFTSNIIIIIVVSCVFVSLPPPQALAPLIDRSLARSMVSPDLRGRDRYDKLNMLGTGTFGDVYKVLDKMTGRHCAVKKVRAERSIRLVQSKQGE